jgi:DNA-binding transcriptional LysR family regulator
MDIDKLKYILTVAEERNFTKAAKKLYISQPALSQYISNLEDELGVKIFDRSCSPLKITIAGERFIKRGKEIIDIRDRLHQEMFEISQGKIGNLKLGVVLNRSPYILPKILPKFFKKFPNVKVQLEEASPSELEELLQRDQIDLAIVPLPLRKESELTVKKIAKEELVLVSCKSEKFLYRQQEKKVSLDEFSSEKFILIKNRQQLRSVIDNYFYRHNFEPDILLESESLECILSLVQEGMGVSCISRTVAESKKWREELLIHSLEGEPFLREYGIVYRAGKTLNIAEQEIIDELSIDCTIKNN